MARPGRDWKPYKGGSMQVKGNAGLVANFHRRRPAVLRAIARATRRASRETKELARQLAPKDTTYMSTMIKEHVPPEAQFFQVYLDPADFVGVYNPFSGELMTTYYPPFVEFGTSRSAAQPFLRPAFEVMAPYYKADVGREVRKALRRGN